MSRGRKALLAAVALAWLAAGEASARELAFVHVEANVGGASGGHTALLLGNRAYHYQLGEGRLLSLEREDWPLFRFRYNVLQNRPLHVAHVDVAPETWQRVRDAFTDVHLTQHREGDRLQELRRDAAALETFLGRRAGVPAPAAGLLDADGRAPASALALGDRLAAHLGPGGFERKLAGLSAGVARSPSDRAALRRWRDRLTLRAALLAVRDGHPLAAEAALQPGASGLSEPERTALARLAETLEQSLARLLTSQRPDGGQILFVALARHRAALRSLREDRLVLVDPFPTNAPSLDRRQVHTRRDELVAISDFLDLRVTEAREAYLDGSPPDERRLARLEVLAARAREYRRGAEDGEPIREPRDILLPQRERALPAPAPIPALADGEERLARLHAELAELEARRAELWHYDLLRDNCVTALADGLDAAFGGTATLSDQLGGRVAADEPFAFIPFVYFGRVASRLAVERVERIPGHRARALARMKRDEGAWRAYARESNTLTASLYRRRDADGSFLLFTDDVVWTRPLYGALNLTWATGDAVLGLLTAPFDRARRLERAGRGMLFSLPELVFVNIRKGSFDASSLQHGNAHAP